MYGLSRTATPPRSHSPHSAAAAAAAGCDVAGLAASDTAGLDVHYFKHLQECLVVECVFFTYALLHVEGRGILPL